MKRHKGYPVAPITRMLQQAEGTTRFHMPGHKGMLDVFDTTELPRTDDLYAPQHGIAEAERMAAASCGAAATILLSGGSTAGLMAMLLSTVAPGETLLLPRNAHNAALSACIWGGIDAVYAEDLLAAIDKNPAARAVLVTRPDYYGTCIDLAPLAERAHQASMLVLVDEAHGAHFPWWDAPRSAGALGADAWVQSAHKTLPALTGGAFLHWADAGRAPRARRFLRMVQTSSPSFFILQSLDEARGWMDAFGARALPALCQMLDGLRQRIDGEPGYENVPSDDPTRLVIGTRGRGYTGLEVQAALATHFIDVEMADLERIVCICTVADKQHSFNRLFAGLRAIPARDALPQLQAAQPAPGPRRCSVREAALSPQEAVPLARCVGRVAALSAGMYPPGIPLVLPGEEVTEPLVRHLQSLPEDRRFGLEAGSLLCMGQSPIRNPI